MKTIEVNGRRYGWPAAPTVVVCIDGSEPDYIEEAVKAGAIRDLVATHDGVLADIPVRVIPQSYATAARNGAAVQR